MVYLHEKRQKKEKRSKLDLTATLRASPHGAREMRKWNVTWHTVWQNEIVHNIMIKLSQIFIANKMGIDTTTRIIYLLIPCAVSTPSSSSSSSCVPIVKMLYWIFTAENSDITLPILRGCAVVSFDICCFALPNDGYGCTILCLVCSVFAWCAPTYENNDSGFALTLWCSAV